MKITLELTELDSARVRSVAQFREVSPELIAEEGVRHTVWVWEKVMKQAKQARLNLPSPNRDDLL